MSPNDDTARRLWCSWHESPTCALAEQAQALYAQAKATQAAVMLQGAYREDRGYHMVVCTGGAHGADEGWITDLAAYPWGEKNNRKAKP